MVALELTRCYFFFLLVAQCSCLSFFFFVGHSSEFLREEVIVLLTAQFITLFNQTALEVRMHPSAGSPPKSTFHARKKMDTERMAYSENSPDVKRIYNLRRKNMNALYLIHRRQSYSWGESCCCKPQISTNPSKSCTRLDWLRLKSPATAPIATQPSLSRAPPIRALFKPFPIGSHEGVLHL